MRKLGKNGSAVGAATLLALLAGLPWGGGPALAASPGGEAGSAQSPPLDLLELGDFGHLAGARSVAGGLRVAHRGFRIVEQDGSGGVPNPPFNLYGTHLSQSGGSFELRATIARIRGKAALTLAGAPPLVYDEFRVDRGSVRLALSRNRLHLSLVGPHSGQRRLVDRRLRLPRRATRTLTVRVRNRGAGRRVSIFAGERRLARFGDAGAFAGGQVWLGFDAARPGGSFLVRRLQAGGAEAVDSAPIAAVPPSPDGLDALARQRRPDFHIGAALSLEPMVSDPPFARLALGNQFGLITTENALKPQFVHPLPGVYDFSEGDALVEIARSHGLEVHGHALAFGEANPRWMQRLARRHPRRMRQVLRRHVSRVVSHYRGQIESWDVVNEPLADYGDRPGPHGLRRNLWLQSIGPAYIRIALRAAHAADPQARLFINEFGLEAGDQRWRTMRRLIERLQAEQVPLDGIGLQSHVYEPGDEISPGPLRRVFDELQRLGLRARISELDVHADHGREQQADQFATVLSSCFAAPSCDSVTFWGVSERYSSTSYLDHGRLRIGEGLPWDRQLRPLPAVAAMRSVLR